MSETDHQSEIQKEEKTGIRWLLDAIAVALITVAVGALMAEEFLRGVVVLALGFALGYIGINWSRLKCSPRARKFTESAEAVGADFRIWLLFILLVFIWAGLPRVTPLLLALSGRGSSQPLSSTAEIGTTSQIVADAEFDSSGLGRAPFGFAGTDKPLAQPMGFVATGVGDQPYSETMSTKPLGRFFDAMRQNTGIVGSELLQKEVGKRLQFTGKLNSATPYEGGRFIEVGIVASRGLITCQFPIIYRPFLEKFDLNSTISGSGVFSSFSSSSLDLRSCRP